MTLVITDPYFAEQVVWQDPTDAERGFVRHHIEQHKAEQNERDEMRSLQLQLQEVGPRVVTTRSRRYSVSASSSGRSDRY